MVFNPYFFNNSEYKNRAFNSLMKAISNRRLIQHLRLELFKKVDYQPKDFIQKNLVNSIVMDDTFLEIILIVEEILPLLNENQDIFYQYFIVNRISNNCKDLLLDNEEELFQWDIHYCKWLQTFYDDEKRMITDLLGYYQKLYDFIILDMTYGDIYDNIHIVN